MKEQEKYEIIKKLVETSGNKDNAALKLSVSRRQINRMMKGYKEQGKAFFVHGNRGRKPATALSEDIRKRIVSLYQEQYFDANFTHFTQLLAEREGILVSTTTIQSILEEHYILSPMVTKAKQKRISAHLKAVQKTAFPPKTPRHNSLGYSIHTDDSQDDCIDSLRQSSRRCSILFSKT